MDKQQNAIYIWNAKMLLSCKRWSSKIVKKYMYNSKRRKCSVRVKKKYSRLIICNYKEEKYMYLPSNIYEWLSKESLRINEGILRSNFVGLNQLYPGLVLLQTVAKKQSYKMASLGHQYITGFCERLNRYIYCDEREQRGIW